MRYFYKRDNTTLKAYLISNGRALEFEPNTQCNGFVAMNSNLLKVNMEVDIVSILQHRGGVEVAFNINSEFSKYVINKPAADIYRNLSTILEPTFTGVRMGEIEKSPWQQLILVYPICKVNRATCNKIIMGR